MELEIQKQITDLAIVATSPIIDQASLDKACVALAVGKGLLRKIEGYFAPMKQGAYDSWKGICAQEKEELDKLRPKVAAIDRIIVDYRQEEERKRQAAEAERRRQEEERRRLEEKTLREAQEKERLAKEASEKAAREKDAEARKKAQEEAARLQAEADKILAKAAAAESKLEPVVVVPERVVTKGTAIRHNWKFRLIDLEVVPDQYKLLNEVLVGRLVRTSEGKIKIPGIEVYDDPSTVSTR